MAEYTSDGLFVWVREFVGASPGGVSVDGRGGVYVVGNFLDMATFESGRVDEVTLTSFGGYDIFLAKYTAPVLPRPPVTLINDKVSFGLQGTSFNPAPVAGGAAGVFVINALLTNTSSQVITAPVRAIVNTLTGGNILLSATHGDGITGSKQQIEVDFDNVFHPGESHAVQFHIGLATRQGFTFLVDVEGVID